MKELINKWFKFITLPQDKANHALHGLIIYIFISLYSPMIAICIVAIIAIGKEVWDSFGNGTPEKLDALATLAIPLVLYAINILMK